MLDTPVLLLLNHWLHQNNWAQQRLITFSGLNIGLHLFDPLDLPIDWLWSIDPTGKLVRADKNATFDTELFFPKGLVNVLLADGKAGIQTKMRIEGRVDFAKAFAEIFSQFRFEPEELLAPWLGDILAVRIVKFSQGIAMQSVKNFQRAAIQMAEFLSIEQPILSHQFAHDDLILQLQTLRDDIARLEKRVDLLTIQ